AAAGAWRRTARRLRDEREGSTHGSLTLRPLASAVPPRRQGPRHGHLAPRNRTLGRRPQERAGHARHPAERPAFRHRLRLQHPLRRQEGHQPGRTDRRRPRRLLHHGPVGQARRSRLHPDRAGHPRRGRPVDGRRPQPFPDPPEAEGPGPRHRREAVPRHRRRRQAELPGFQGPVRRSDQPRSRAGWLSRAARALPQVLRSPDKAAGRIRGRRGTTCRWAFPDALRLSGLRAGRLPPSPAPGIVDRTSLPPDDAMQLRATRALPLLLATAFAAANAQAAAQNPVPPAYAGTTADAVLTAARIHTLDASRPQATAIAWDKDGRIVATGDAAELRHRYPQARLVDAGDATVIPGLIDAHAHVMELGYALLRADLSGAKSTQEVIERLQAYAASAPEGSWIIGWGWDQNLWPGAQFPTAADLDAAF